MRLRPLTPGCRTGDLVWVPLFSLILPFTEETGEKLWSFLECQGKGGAAQHVSLFNALLGEAVLRNAVEESRPGDSPPPPRSTDTRGAIPALAKESSAFWFQENLQRHVLLS